VYTEASGNCNQQTASLVSPCIDLAGTSEPTLSFYYHMLGADIGTLQVDVLTKNGWVDNLFSRSGNQGGQWQRAEIDLSPYIDDTIAIRIKGTTGNDFAGDMALDFIYLFEKTPLQAAFQANDTVCVGDVVSFTNQSNSIDISYSWNFGQGANPAGATTQGPHNVVYSTPGLTQARLIVSRGAESDTIVQDIWVLEDTKADFSAIANGQTITFTDASTQATLWHWDFGDGDTSSAQNPVHTFADTGSYTVVLTVEGPCGIDNKSADYLVYGVGIPTLQGIDAVLSPNPASQVAQLTLSGQSEGGFLHITDMQGRRVISQAIPSFQGQVQLPVAIQQWPAGIYRAQVTLEEGSIHLSLVVQQ
jgi:PKD repeat protein